jgi:hypothetical protein
MTHNCSTSTSNPNCLLFGTARTLRLVPNEAVAITSVSCYPMYESPVHACNLVVRVDTYHRCWALLDTQLTRARSEVAQ